MTASRGLRRWAVALICVVGLSGCEAEAPPSGYFPLREGLNWFYQVTTESPLGRRTEPLKITSYGRLVDDQEYYMRGTDSGNYYYFTKRDDGVTRIGHRAIIDDAVRFDDPGRPVIKEPIEVGTQWRYRMRPYLLSSETEPHLRDSIWYEAQWRIVATDVSVDTPLGRFDDCLHIRGVAEVPVPRSFLLHLAPHIMNFEINEWYAPGVGLVKLRYAETTDSRELKGGTIAMDLVAFEF